MQLMLYSVYFSLLSPPKILHFEHLLAVETCFIHIYQVELSGTLLWGMLNSTLVESDWAEYKQRT